MDNLRRILVATDFSEQGNGAVRYAAALAARVEAELILVHAYQPPILPAADPSGMPTYFEVTRAIAERAALDLDQLKAALGPGVRVNVELREGDPRTVILDVARERAADLIVVGTHGRTGLARLVMGSVAEAIVRHADRPVLAWRKR